MAASKMKRLYQSLDMPVEKYFTRYALPLVIAGIGATALLVFLFPELAADGLFKNNKFLYPFITVCHN